MSAKGWLAIGAGLLLAATFALMILAVNLTDLLTAYFVLLSGVVAGAAAMLLVKLHFSIGANDNEAEARQLYSDCMSIAHVNIAPSRRIDS